MPNWLKSIKTRILLPLLLIIFMTGAFVLLILSNSKSLDKLTSNFETMLSDQLSSRVETIDKNTLVATGQVIQTAGEITEQASALIKKNNSFFNEDGSFKMSYRLSDDLNDMAVPYVIDNVKIRGISGAYVIWNSSPDNQALLFDGIHIIDNKADALDHGNNDLRIKIGPSLTSYEKSIMPDKDWLRYFSSDKQGENNSQFAGFDQAHIFIEKLKRSNMNDFAQSTRNGLAYWSQPFVTGSIDGRIVYTSPLIDEEMRLIGLFGLEIDPASILSALPLRDPVYETSSFMVGIKNADGTIQLEKRLSKETASDLFELADAEDGVLSIRPLPSAYDNLYTAEIIGHNEHEVIDNYFFAIKGLESILSPDRSDNRQWVIVELVEQSEFINPTKDFEYRILLVLLSAMLLAGIAAFAVGSNLAGPIIKISKQLRNQKVEEEITLPRFNITELDHLSSSIEHMSRRLRDSSFKTASIIDLLDLPIASFEEQPDDNIVIVSSAMRDLLDLNMEDKLQSNLSMITWNKIVALLLSDPEPGYNDVYRWQSGKQRSVKWLRIRQAKHDGKVSGIIVDVSEEVIKHRRLEKELDYDDLTQLYTRQAFMHRVEDRLKHAEEGQYAVMLFADLDNLKQINDTYGHQFGDKYLQLAASFMNHFIAIGGYAARFAGDEFSAFAGMESSYESAVENCSKILALLPEQIIRLPDNTIIDLRLSIGAAVYPTDAATVGELIDYADFAMYQRKRNGKNGLTWFDKKQYYNSRRKYEVN